MIRSANQGIDFFKAKKGAKIGGIAHVQIASASSEAMRVPYSRVCKLTNSEVCNLQCCRNAQWLGTPMNRVCISYSVLYGALAFVYVRRFGAFFAIALALQNRRSSIHHLTTRSFAFKSHLNRSHFASSAFSFSPTLATTIYYSSQLHSRTFS